MANKQLVKLRVIRTFTMTDCVWAHVCIFEGKEVVAGTSVVCVCVRENSVILLLFFTLFQDKSTISLQ